MNKRNVLSSNWIESSSKQVVSLHANDTVIWRDNGRSLSYHQLTKKKSTSSSMMTAGLGRICCHWSTRNTFHGRHFDETLAKRITRQVWSIGYPLDNCSSRRRNAVLCPSVGRVTTKHEGGEKRSAEATDHAVVVYNFRPEKRKIQPRKKQTRVGECVAANTERSWKMLANGK